MNKEKEDAKMDKNKLEAFFEKANQFLDSLLEETDEKENQCKKLDKGKWVCKPGCKTADLEPGETCPFETDKEAKEDCPCYQ